MGGNQTTISVIASLLTVALFVGASVGVAAGWNPVEFIVKETDQDSTEAQAAVLGAGPLKFGEYRADPNPSRAINAFLHNGAATAAEPTVGVDWNTPGEVMFRASLTTHRASFDDSVSQPIVSWQGVTDVLDPITHLDPMLHTDEITGRTWSGGLIAAGGCSFMVASDDLGESWLPQVPCSFIGADHQTIGSGPYAVPLDVANGAPEPFNRVVYTCSQAVVSTNGGVANPATGCAASFDGGITWQPGSFWIGGCGGLHGHVRVSEVTGTAAVPDKTCGSDQMGFVYSDNNGATWIARTVSGSKQDPYGGFDPSLDFSKGTAEDPTDANGWLYYGYGGGLGAFVAMSKDEGVNWEDLGSGHAGVTPTTWLDVGQFADPPVKSAVFSDMRVGDDDRAAFAFLGSTEPGSNAMYDSCAGAGQYEWFYYVSVTYDAGQTWTTQRITEDPVQIGAIWDSGGGAACRNLLDFNDMDIDEKGRLIIGYADGCIDTCVDKWENDNAGPGDSRSEWGHILRQYGGKTLFSKFDAAEPLTVDAGGPYTGVADQPITITGSATGGSTPYTFAWSASPDAGTSFGDPAAASTSFTAPEGTYTLTLTVNDAVSDTAQVTVNDQGGPFATVFSVDGNVVSDGDAGTVTPDNGQVQVLGQYGTSGSNQNPTAAFLATPSGLTVSFDAADSSDPDGDDLTYAWDFGDSSTGTGVTTSHTFAADGTYTVALTVTDGNGGTDTAEQDVTVSGGPTGGWMLYFSGDEPTVDAGGSLPCAETATYGLADAAPTGTESKKAYSGLSVIGSGCFVNFEGTSSAALSLADGATADFWFSCDDPTLSSPWPFSRIGAELYVDGQQRGSETNYDFGALGDTGFICDGTPQRVQLDLEVTVGTADIPADATVTLQLVVFYATGGSGAPGENVHFLYGSMAHPSGLRSTSGSGAQGSQMSGMGISGHEGGEYVEVFLDGTSEGYANLDGNGAWDFDLDVTGLTGEHTVGAEYTVDGSTSARSLATFTIQGDTGGGLLITSPADGATVPGDQPLDVAGSFTVTTTTTTGTSSSTTSTTSQTSCASASDDPFVSDPHVYHDPAGVDPFFADTSLTTVVAGESASLDFRFVESTGTNGACHPISVGQSSRITLDSPSGQILDVEVQTEGDSPGHRFRTDYTFESDAEEGTYTLTGYVTSQGFEYEAGTLEFEVVNPQGQSQSSGSIFGNAEGAGRLEAGIGWENPNDGGNGDYVYVDSPIDGSFADGSTTLTGRAGNSPTDPNEQCETDCNPPFEFGEPQPDHIRPGDSSQVCTLNFVYEYQGRYFFGSAAHCAATGSNTDTNGCQTPPQAIGSSQVLRSKTTQITATLAYSSWGTMQRTGETNGNACFGNDFALFEIDEDDFDKIHPSVRMYGGPTGLGTIGGMSTGDEIHGYGRSSLHDDTIILNPDQSLLNPKTGVYLGPGNGGWSYWVYLLPQGVPGDSGGGIFDAEGNALGAASTISALGASNNYANIERALAYMADKEGWAPTLVTWDEFDAEPRDTAYGGPDLLTQADLELAQGPPVNWETMIADAAIDDEGSGDGILPGSDIGHLDIENDDGTAFDVVLELNNGVTPSASLALRAQYEASFTLEATGVEYQLRAQQDGISGLWSYQLWVPSEDGQYTCQQTNHVITGEADSQAIRFNVDYADLNLAALPTTTGTSCNPAPLGPSAATDDVLKSITASSIHVIGIVNFGGTFGDSTDTPGDYTLGSGTTAPTVTFTVNGVDAGSAPVTDGTWTHDIDFSTFTKNSDGEFVVVAAHGTATETMTYVAGTAPGCSDGDGDIRVSLADLEACTPFDASMSGSWSTQFPDISTVAPGTHTLTATLYDGAGDQVDTHSIQITIGGSNGEPPVLAPIGDQNGAEGALISFDVSATDPDSTTVELTFSWDGPTSSPFTDDGDNTGTFSWTPTFDDAGTYQATVTAEDPDGNVDSETFAITVANTNRAPTISVDPTGPYTVAEGASLSIAVAAADADGDDVTLDQTGDAVGSLTDNGDGTGTWTWTPDYDEAGAYNLEFTASDGTDVGTTGPLTLTVTDTPLLTIDTLNDGPLTAAASKVSTLAGTYVDPEPPQLPLPEVEDVTYFLHRTDCGGADQLFMDRINDGVDGGDGCGSLAHPIGPVWEAAIGELTDVFPRDNTGEVDLALDPARNVEASVWVTGYSGVTENPQPVPNLIMDIEFELFLGETRLGGERVTDHMGEGTPTEFTFSFPASVTDIPATGELEAHVTVHHAVGPAFINFGGETASKVTLPMAPFEPPQVEVQVAFGENPQAWDTITSGFGDTWSYDWNTLELPDGPYTFNARAMKEGIELELATVNLEVDNDRPPVLDTIGDRQVDENAPLTFPTTAADPDGDTVIISATGLPSGAAHDGDSFSWTPTFDQQGTYDVTFTADDQTGNTVSETITITVHNVNRDPVITFSGDPLGDYSVDRDATLTFTVTATDPDGGDLTLEATSLPDGATFTLASGSTSSGTVSWTPVYGQGGQVYSLDFEATDDLDETVTASASVEVIEHDNDNDGVLNRPDNCPDKANPSQSDLDRDNKGDACDEDIDGDGQNNDVDRYPFDRRRW